MNINKFIITEEEYNKVKIAEKNTKDKRISRRLKVIQYSYEGLTNKAISEKLDYNEAYITQILKKFKKEGLDEFTKNKYKANRSYMSIETEERILSKFEGEAEKGNIISVKEIRKEIEEEIGRKTPDNYVYRLLNRHNWRKVLPRRKHPKSASKEEQDSSKKLRKLH
ncbi:MAG: winged helix-turn-helix domain-containing protein [Firmicutes bacterium]|nr:winged helix-turn-helix domain-containing protein [Bacillota bacterium]